MNREILFRGKREDNDQWVYGNLLHRHLQQGFSAKMVSYTDLTYLEVDPETVGQYSGLNSGLNFDGPKIFEDDIIAPNPGGEVFRVCFEKGRFVVKHRKLSVFKALGYYWGIWGTLYDFLIQFHENVHLGNIHDNPELIEVIPSAK